MMTDTRSSSFDGGRRIFVHSAVSDQVPSYSPSHEFLRTFFRILARNVLFLGGGRGPTPEEVDERDDVRR
jgi:hypothetical protein